jgi:hypothetical protein
MSYVAYIDLPNKTIIDLPADKVEREDCESVIIHIRFDGEHQRRKAECFIPSVDINGLLRSVFPDSEWELRSAILESQFS